MQSLKDGSMNDNNNKCKRRDVSPRAFPKLFGRLSRLAAMAVILWPIATAAQLTFGEEEIFQAARAGDTAGVDYLLKKGNDVDKTGVGGITVLIIAAANGYQDLLDLALQEGAQIDRQDDSGKTALGWAAQRGHYTVVERLLDKGADLNLQNRDGMSSLMLAVKGRHLSVVQLMLGYKPDLTLLDYTGRGVLDLARETRDRRLEDMLGRAGAGN